MIITIDGTAGSGKSWAAQELGRVLGYEVLSTGAMYRAAGLLLREAGFDIAVQTAQLAAIAEFIQSWEFELSPTSIKVNGVDLTDRIPGEVNGQAASMVGELEPVRRKLQQAQREYVGNRSVICEGRDQGSVVFPNAPLKFYFDATPEARAARRITLDRHHPDYPRALADLAEQLKLRDLRDKTRELDPLVIPVGAIVIDSTNKDQPTVLQEMLDAVAKCRSAPSPTT